MAEPRRVQFTPSCGSGPPATRRSPPGVLQANTVRLALTLFEPDERRFPEFSYSQLLDNKVHRAKSEVLPSRSEEEERRVNDEAAAIVKKLEEKYGVKPKKKDRIQDLIDIGYGYDDEDSFIDNSEAYDEFVPASITTKFGGFYVNSGVLQFRQASDTEDTTVEKIPESTKKRKLDLGREKPKKKPCREDGGMKRSVDPKPSALPETGLDDEMMVMKKKKKKAVGALSVTSMLKKFQREKERERKKLEANQRAVAAIAGAPTMPLCPADAAGGGGSGLTDPLLNLIGSTNDHALIQAANTMDFDIDLDRLLDVSEGTEVQLFQPKTEDLAQGQPPETLPHTHADPKHHPEPVQLPSQSSSTLPYQCVPLPEGLPAGLEDAVRKLTAAAKTSEGESKVKFFTPEINSILLEIELQCREQGGQLRSKVYTHLSSFLPCSRETLLKRVKKLLLSHMEEEDPPDAEDPMHKLKEAISKVMPEQIARFNENCQVYEQVKPSKATEEEKDGKQKVNPGAEDSVEEKGGKRGGPKKLFEWNDETRECLCHVLKKKMEKHKHKRKGSQELEEHLKTLLDNEVKPLWPKGWMQSRVLMRESRNILSLFTSLPLKRPRPEKKSPSINGPPTSSDGCGAFQGSPPMKGDFPEKEASEKGEGKPRCAAAVGAGSSTSAESDEPLVTTASATPPSLLDLLADQALAQEQTHELLAAAVAKYKRSIQNWSFALDTKSPPFPPPPPQSSPVGFPVNGLCQVVLPQLLQMGDMDAGQEQIISNNDDIIR